MRSKTALVSLFVIMLVLLPAPAKGEGAPPGLTGGPLESGSASLWSVSAGTLLGQSVSIAGDVNGDGFADILIGQPGDDESLSWEGMVLLRLGGPTGWSHSMSPGQSDAVIFGETAGDWAGFSVSGAGDFNGDGFDDILIGAPKRNGGEGAVYLILGREVWADVHLSSADAIFSGSGGENAGWNVSAAGDLDADGLDDVVIGAPWYNSSHGRVYALFGQSPPVNRLLVDADVILEGEAAGDLAGFSVAGGGDVNGDRYDDLVIGAPSQTADGRAYLVTDLIPGPFPLTRNLSAADGRYSGLTSQSLGFSVDMVDDMNGDGFADILASFTGGTGGAYLLLGSSSPLPSCTLDFCADQGYRGITGDAVGGRVANVGDVNADGYGDLLIGSCSYSNGAARGRTSLILGEANPSGVIDFAVDQLTHFTGMSDGDTACVAQNGAGDVNGDGISDLLIGAPGFNGKEGRAYLIFADETEAEAARYRSWTVSYYGHPVGQSGVTALRIPSSGGEYGTLYITRNFRGTCNTARDSNGLLWTVDSQLGSDAELQFIFKYNDAQIAGWLEADLKLWYRDRPCQDWSEDTGATLEPLANRFASGTVIDPHREYTISPTAPSPTQLDLTGTGAFLAPKSVWPVLAAVLLLVATIGLDVRRRRSANRSEG